MRSSMLLCTLFTALLDSSLLVAGQFFCSGACSNVDCAVAGQVNQVYPPTLALSTPAFNLVGSQQVIYIQYGTPLGLSLLPCSSIGRLSQVLNTPLHCCTASVYCTVFKRLSFDRDRLVAYDAYLQCHCCACLGVTTSLYRASNMALSMQQSLVPPVVGIC